MFTSLHLHQLQMHITHTHTGQVAIISIINHVWTPEDMWKMKVSLSFLFFLFRDLSLSLFKRYPELFLPSGQKTHSNCSLPPSLPVPLSSLGLVFSRSSPTSITLSVLSPSLSCQISLQKEHSRFKGESRLV